MMRFGLNLHLNILSSCPIIAKMLLHVEISESSNAINRSKLLRSGVKIGVDRNPLRLQRSCDIPTRSDQIWSISLGHTFSTTCFGRLLSCSLQFGHLAFVDRTAANLISERSPKEVGSVVITEVCS